MPFKDREKALAYFRKYNHEKRSRDKQRTCVRRYNKTHPEVLRRAGRNFRLKHPECDEKVRFKKRMWIINFFGGKCIECGETDSRVLQIHHINGKANSKYKRVVNSMSRPQIIEEAPNLVLLCANCHARKRASHLFSLL